MYRRERAASEPRSDPEDVVWRAIEIGKRDRREQGVSNVYAGQRSREATAKVWGAIIALWIAVVAIPFVGFTLAVAAKRKSINDSRFTRFCVAWLPGFVALLGLALLEMPPGWGLIWTLTYVIGAIIYRVWGRRIREWSPSRRTRQVLALLALWVAALQAWGFIFDWSDHFELSQFLALHVFPPALAVASWWAWRWTMVAHSDPEGDQQV